MTEIDLDHHTGEHADDPFASFSRVREQCPVAHSPHYGGFWAVTGWQAATEVGQDPKTYSSAIQPDGRRALHIPTTGARAVAQPPLELEPPEFVAYRRLLDPFCSPRALAEMEDGIHYWADYFLDRVIESGSMSVVSDFATAVPSTITIDWLGLPPGDWHFYWEAMDVEHHAKPGTPEADLAHRLMTELTDRLREEIRDRVASPRDDLLSVIANGIVNGAPMTEDRALGTTMLLIAGGTATTADLFAHALLHLDTHRDVHARLLEDDRFMRTATEEYLRISTPVLAIGRIATADVELGGQQIRAGEHVLNCWAGANRDPAVFEDPDEVRLERWPNRHLSFGVGPHRCIGSNLGRAMFRVMTRRFLERLPDFRVTSSERVDNRSLFSGFARIDVAFTPGAKVLPEAPPAAQFHAAYAEGAAEALAVDGGGDRVAP